MAGVMADESARKADRLEAAKWLADRGFGRAVQALDIDVSRHPSLVITRFSSADLEALIAIVEKYEPHAAELAQSGEIPFDAGPVRAVGYRQR